MSFHFAGWNGFGHTFYVTKLSTQSKVAYSDFWVLLIDDKAFSFTTPAEKLKMETTVVFALEGFKDLFCDTVAIKMWTVNELVTQLLKCFKYEGNS